MDKAERISEVFTRIDSDGSGELSLAEIQAHRESTKDRRQAKREEMKEKMQARREARMAAKSMKNAPPSAKPSAKKLKPSARASPEDRFAKVDTDQSGGISLAEFQAALAQRQAKRAEMKEKMSNRRDERKAKRGMKMAFIQLSCPINEHPSSFLLIPIPRNFYENPYLRFRLAVAAVGLPVTHLSAEDEGPRKQKDGHAMKALTLEDITSSERHQRAIEAGVAVDVAAIFAKADANADGTLTKEEMPAFHKAMQSAHRTNMFARIDNDGSGELSLMK